MYQSGIKENLRRAQYECQKAVYRQRVHRKDIYSPKEWEVDRETAFYYRIVNRNTGKKKWLGKEYFHAETTDYPHRPCE